MKYGYGAASTHKQINLFGKSAMISLEDMINVNPTNNVSLAYEVNREFGMFMKSTNYNVSSGCRYSLQVNNIPP
jgi:hypothetical protein